MLNHVDDLRETWVLGGVGQLAAVGNSTAGICGATPGSLQRRQAEGHRTGCACLESTVESILCSLELALEETIELAVSRSLLAVGNLGRVRGVAGLLSEDLGELDHVGVVVELLRQVDHLISSILLIARSSGSEKGHESRLRDGVALLGSPGGSLHTRRVRYEMTMVNTRYLRRPEPNP